jgi:hypothetical protein
MGLDRRLYGPGPARALRTSGKLSNGLALLMNRTESGLSIER